MSSNARGTHHSDGDRGPTGGSSSHHTLRKRHSPTNQGTSGAAAGSQSNVETSANYSKLRKLQPSTKSTQSTESTTGKSTSKGTSSSSKGESSTSTSSGHSNKRAPGARELVNLIQPLADQQAASDGGCLTRSKAKAIIQQQIPPVTGGSGGSAGVSQATTKPGSSSHQHGSSRKTEQANPSSTAATKETSSQQAAATTTTTGGGPCCTAIGEGWFVDHHQRQPAMAALNDHPTLLVAGPPLPSAGAGVIFSNSNIHNNINNSNAMTIQSQQQHFHASQGSAAAAAAAAVVSSSIQSFFLNQNNIIAQSAVGVGDNSAASLFVGQFGSLTGVGSGHGDIPPYHYHHHQPNSGAAAAVIMNNPLLPSSVAAAVHQHQRRAAAAVTAHATSAAADLVSTFASQLAAAVVVGTGSGTANAIGGTTTAAAAAALAENAIGSFMEQHTVGAHFHQQQFVQQQQIAVANAELQQQQHPPPPAPFQAAAAAPASIGINRSALGLSLSSPHGGGGKTGASMASMFATKSQRATGFLNSLVPRMQHLLGGGGGAGGSTSSATNAADTIGDGHHNYMGLHHHHHHLQVTTPAIMSIVEGLKSSNEIRQSEAATELAEMLLLGNEETLPNIPIVEIVQALCGLLQKDNNFDLMLNAARCITNMQEALPRALPVIADAIPLLLSKLKRIEYIDVAEQSLIALEVMSRRNAKNILLQGGIALTISHVDFFSISSQRLAYSIAANCAIYVTNNEFQLVRDCIPDMTQRMVYMEDKRCIESICIFFNRIIENMRQHPERLRQISGPNFEFLQNVQKLLAIQPSNISSNTYLALLKSIRYICSQCPDASLALVRIDFGNTLRFLLVGPERTDPNLITGEPSEKTAASVDFNSRPGVQLREILTLIGQLVENLPSGSNEVVSLLHLFPLLVEIGTNSSCTQLRNESLTVMRSMVKMVENAEHLEPFLRDIPLAVYITQMLSSNRNLGILLGSLQLARALLEKLPQLYIPLFESEGVFYETNRLTSPIESPTIDRKPAHNLRSTSTMAEQILEGLVNTSSQSGTGGVRVIIPPMLLGQNNGAGANNQSHQQNLQQQQDLVCKEAKYIVEKFSGDHAARKFNIKEPHKPKKIYDKLCILANKFKCGKDLGTELLNELKNLLLEQEITSFQFNQSGIAPALTHYLTDTSAFTHPLRAIRLKRFASVFMNLNEKKINVDSVGAGERFQPFEKLITMVLTTIGAVEQFQVRVTNLSGIITNGSGSSLASYQSAALLTGSGGGSGAAALFSTTLRGAQALRFFQTHQIRLNLRRHANCKSLREWRHGRGSIKVDPFTSVSSIERYLLERGIAIVSQTGQQPTQQSDGDDDSDISDEDHDLSFTSGNGNDGRIDLYIGDNHLPTDISILQAIRQFSLPQDDDSIETIPSSIWLASHTIYYSSPNEGPTVTASTTKSSSGSNSTQSTASSDTRSATSTNKSSTTTTADHTSSSGLTSRTEGGTGSGWATIHPQAAAAAGALSTAKNTSSSSLAVGTTAPVVLRSTRTRLHQKLLGMKKTTVGAGGSSTSGVASSGTTSSATSKDSQVYKTGQAPKRVSPLDTYLKNQLSLETNDPSLKCLMLLKLLYGLNAYWWDLLVQSDSEYEQGPPVTHASLIPQSTFLSAKLNSKVSRQLSDFLSVATQQIPKWTTDLVKTFPFLFSFTTRRSFLFCTSFGRDRALMHLVNEANNDDGHDGGGNDAASRLIPRLERRKVTIKRDNLLKEAQQSLMQMNTSKALLEVGFDGEIGTGFGPTLEFYSALSRALQKNSLRLWAGTVQKANEVNRDGTGDDDYVFAANGLYPQITHGRALSPKQNDLRIKRFEFIGRLLGQALLDSKMLDLPLSSAFFKWLIGDENSLGMEDFENLEPQIYRSLCSLAQTKTDDFGSMEMYFTYPGENSMELMKSGKNIQVNKVNCAQFMDLVCYWRLVEGVRPEMEAVQRGFQLVINKDSLRIFSSDEMELLFCGSSEENERIWAKTTLQHAIRPDHGYAYDSKQIRWLIDMLNSYTKDQRRRFLQFVTGSPRLPVGGFRGLNPPLTVVKKTATCSSNEHELPSAMTCYNYLKIPPYESYKTFVARFNVALEHVTSFYLT